MLTKRYTGNLGSTKSNSFCKKPPILTIEGKISKEKLENEPLPKLLSPKNNSHGLLLVTDHPTDVKEL